MLSSRAPAEVVWCRYSTNTFLLVTMHRFFYTDRIALLLQETAGAIQDDIARRGPGLVSSKVFTWVLRGILTDFTFRAWNEHNDAPMSWSMINDALVGLYDFMNQNQFGSCLFVIYDGASLVGRGSIEFKWNKH